MDSLFQQISSLTTLRDAWQTVSKRGKAGGIDKVTIDSFAADQQRQLERLSVQLTTGSYIPEPYRRISIPKPGKPREQRLLSLPTIADKIVQQALKQLLEPVCEHLFLDVSYAYRPRKGPARAIRRIGHIIEHQKCSWAVQADIDSFFDTMDHGILIKQLKTVTTEPEIIKLVRMWLKIGTITEQLRYRKNNEGTAQGSVISPLLSNLYLHPLDRFMVKSGIPYVRYADNLSCFTTTKKEAESLLRSIHSFLQHTLKLKLNSEPQYVFHLASGFEFMGVCFKNRHRFISSRRLALTERQLAKLVSRNFPRGWEIVAEKLKEKVTGFNRYYQQVLSDPHQPADRLNLFLGEALTEVAAATATGKRLPRRDKLRHQLATVPLFGEPDIEKHKKWCNTVVTAIRRKIKEKKQKLSPSNHSSTKPTVVDPEKAVARRRAAYEKSLQTAREVHVEGFGSFVGKTKGSLVVKKRGLKIRSLPLKQVETLSLAGRGTTISSDLVIYCLEHNISLYFTDEKGMSAAVIIDPGKGLPRHWLAQTRACEHGQPALLLACEFVEGKIRNQINLLKFYRRHRGNHSPYGIKLNHELPAMKRAAESAASLANKKIENLEKVRSRLMGYEADAARRYWSLVRLLLEDDVYFPGRRHQQANDLVNNLLNYGYGFLYRQAWHEIIRAGLHPQISFLHTFQTNRPALVYDVVEEFRSQAVDRVVFSALTKGEQFALEKKKGRISRESCHKLLNALLERQATAVPYRGQKILLKNVLRLQVQLLCLHLEQKKAYRHFRCYY